MSIVASTLVHDGLVLGADSVAKITGRDNSGKISTIQSYQHAQKLYRVAPHIGVATWGIGNLGPRSVGSFIADHARKLAPTQPREADTVQAVTQALLKTFQEAYEEQFKLINVEARPTLGVLVGGYSPEQPLAEEWEFEIPTKPQPKRIRPFGAFGASWRGVPRPFTRLYKGFDPLMHQLNLLRKGVTAQELDQLTAQFVLDGMPVQEAIDFVVFILQTTINVSKFEAGIASCGGPLWVSLITRSGFKWVQRPEWRVREV